MADTPPTPAKADASDASLAASGRKRPKRRRVNIGGDQAQTADNGQTEDASKGAESAITLSPEELEKQNRHHALKLEERLLLGQIKLLDTSDPIQAARKERLTAEVTEVQHLITDNEKPDGQATSYTTTVANATNKLARKETAKAART